MIRLDKYLADMGLGTRQEVKKKIRKGMVLVNQETIKSPDCKIREGVDLVSVEGRIISYVAYEYYMLNKPAGVVSATEDSRNQTVVDLLQTRRRKDLFPVGRLDKDTEGLLLITNDGGLAHRLLAPRRHVDKTYYAEIQGCVTKEDVRLFREGIDIGTDGREELTMPAILELITAGDESKVRLTIQEGKYHQVKRMFEALGKEVTYLKRERMGPLTLDENLKTGEYRQLTDEELEGLKELENVGDKNA